MTNEELVSEIQQGKNIMDNMQQLYLQNKPLISQTVKLYVSYADIDDLMQEAYFGLHRAVELYKPETGNAFITYALHWIRQSASMYAMNTGNTKRLPINVVTLISRHKKFLSDFQKQYNQSPTDEEVCNNLNITQKKLNNLLKFEHELNCTSMDAPIKGADGDIAISESVASDTDIENDVVENVTKREDAESLWSLVGQLPDRQRDVIVDIYKNSMTCKELGEKLGVSKQMVDSIRKKGIEKLSRRVEIKRIAVDYDYFPGAYRGSVGRFKNTGTSSTEHCAIKRVSTMQRYMQLRMEMDAVFGVSRNGEERK